MSRLRCLMRALSLGVCLLGPTLPVCASEVCREPVSVELSRLCSMSKGVAELRRPDARIGLLGMRRERTRLAASHTRILVLKQPRATDGVAGLRRQTPEHTAQQIRASS